nr:MAG TPA: hypothetical protein [Caudoviricetes sp.]
MPFFCVLNQQIYSVFILSICKNPIWSVGFLHHTLMILFPYFVVSNSSSLS